MKSANKRKSSAAGKIYFGFLFDLFMKHFARKQKEANKPDFGLFSLGVQIQKAP